MGFGFVDPLRIATVRLYSWAFVSGKWRLPARAEGPVCAIWHRPGHGRSTEGGVQRQLLNLAVSTPFRQPQAKRDVQHADVKCSDERTPATTCDGADESGVLSAPSDSRRGDRSRLGQASGTGDPQRGLLRTRAGPVRTVFPRTPACYGFTIIAKVIPGREEAIREHGRTIQAAVENDPEVLAPLKLHYLRWQLFNIGDDLYFQYQGIFDTDFDKYTEDAVTLFSQSASQPPLRTLKDSPRTGENVPRGSSRSFVSITYRAFSNTASIPT